MPDTARLGLPLIAAGQAQKHVTHNEALIALDALVQMRLLALDANTPPASPAEGDAYAVGSAPTGAFAGKGGAVAVFAGGAWTFLTPAMGWTAWVAATGKLAVRQATGWVSLENALRRLTDLEVLCVGTGADPSNPVSIRANAALFAAKPTGEGGTGDLRVTFNKSGTAQTASHVFQSNWSARAETGLAGDDRWRLKVSPNGTTWRDAIVADPANGSVRIDALLAGRAAPGFGARAEIGFAGATVGMALDDGTAGTGTGTAVSFRRAGVAVGAITISATGTSYATTSDHRLKVDVAPLDDAAERLARLKPSRFAFAADPSRRLDGFIAHEVAVAVPEAVNGEKDAVDEQGRAVPQTVDLSRLVPLLTAAVQELAARVSGLERTGR